MKFDLPKDQASIIKVIGVGGGGGNAVNHMYRQGIKGVDFIVCNTDQQALEISPVPLKIQLGASLTEGRGAGSLPDVGENAAIESMDEINELLDKNTKMLFVTAGMGGGTGTGAAPVIAQAAKERGILTVGIITVPFNFEGKKRRLQAEEGISKMRKSVDTLLIICNDKLREMYGNLTLVNAFAQADEVLSIAAKGIAEIITVTGSINVDFEDVRTVMTNSGAAIMGTGIAHGEDRSLKSVEQALSSPLLNDNLIKGAKYVLLNITYGSSEVLMDEITEITDYIQNEAGSTADVIWGHGIDESLEDNISVTIIATGFDSKVDTGFEISDMPNRKVMNLEDDPSEEEETSLEDEGSSVEEELSSVEEDESFSASMETDEIPGSVEEPIKRYNLEDNQRAIEFEISNPSAIGESVDSELQEPELVQNVTPVVREFSDPVKEEISETIIPEEQQQKADERIEKFKQMSTKLRTPSGISDLEDVPAYKRRNVELSNVPHSSESEVSRYTLSEPEIQEGTDNESTDSGNSEIKPNNSFLHDNVD